MDKKSQITLVILFAVLILLVGAVAIYLFLGGEERIAIPELKAVAEGAKPVSSYVTSCLEMALTDGLDMVGARAGFLDVALRKDVAGPTNGEAVAMAAKSDVVVPYWHHLAAENTCERDSSCYFVTQIPSEKQVKQNIKAFIEANLNDCLADFQALPNFVVEPLGNPEAEVFITKEDVKSLLRYPLKVTIGGQELIVDEFLAAVPLNLKQILELAKELTALEAEMGYLESHTINLLGFYSDIDENKLPPFGKTDLSFKRKLWVKSVLKEKLKKEVLPNLQLLRIAYFDEDSGNSRLQVIRLDAGLNEIDEEMVDALLNRGTVIPLKKDYTGLHTAFSYLPWWDIYFDLNCRDELCGSQEIGVNYLTVFGIQRYQFAYDISYPVMVEIFDPAAMDSRGYVFRFMLEANIRDNKRLEADQEIVPAYEIVETRTMLCEQLASEEHSINVMEGGSNAPASNAQASFICGAERCPLGEIEAGVLKTALPRCLNGGLVVAKDGFYPATIMLDTFSNRKQILDIKLEPYRKKEVKPKIYPLVKEGERGGWKFNPSALQLGLKDEAVITFAKINRPGEESHTVVADIVGDESTVVNPCDGNPKNEIKAIELVPGDYNITVLVLSYENITIPPERREASSWPVTEKYTVPGMEFGCQNPLPIGLINFKWHLEAGELDSGDMVEVYGIAADFRQLPDSYKKIEDVGVTAETQMYAGMYKSLIQPRLRKQ